MTGSDEDTELPKPNLFQHWWASIRPVILASSPIIAMACALVTGYFAHAVLSAKPPSDISGLAISILKSEDAPPEMREWAANALKIRTDIPSAK
jgi:hypothetical protein